MAGYRQIHTQIWKDEWFIELDAKEKLLFIYLFSNDLSSISGLYKIPIKVIANETGLTPEFIVNTLAKFEEQSKILYREGVLWIVNMGKYHKNASPHTTVKVDNDVAQIPDCLAKRAYLYHKNNDEYNIDTVSILISESKSVNKNKSENKSESESESKNATPAPLFSDNEAEKIYRTVTNHMSTPSGERQEIYLAIQTVISQKGHDTAVEYLRPFWGECKKRYPGTMKAFWLTDWAVTGAIPPPPKPGGNGSKPAKSDPLMEEIQRRKELLKNGKPI